MKQDCIIWNTLHDGYIVDIDGSIPGDISLKVEIEYLANRLPGNASFVVVSLHGCNKFCYEFYLSSKETIYYKKLNEIKEQAPIIISCEKNGDDLYVSCACGQIEMSYESSSLLLASGKSLSYELLDEICTEYWEEWEHAART